MPSQRPESLRSSCFQVAIAVRSLAILAILLGTSGVEAAESPGPAKSATLRFPRTTHPDAQWYGEAGFGMFIHWGICTVKQVNIGWSMIAGQGGPLEAQHIDNEAERQRIIDHKDWMLTGKPVLTPREYWEQAKDFNPSSYNPEAWAKAAAEAGMTYMVLTTKHHDGFALWPTKYGDFNTRNYLNGRDFVAEYIAACRKYGLKVGLYFSAPDWYFDRDYKNFLFYLVAKKNPEFPELDADLKPRAKHTPEEIAAHKEAYKERIRNQLEELLTNYGKIDLLFFDGRPFPEVKTSIPIERIRELQPGCVLNDRMYDSGDYTTFERKIGLSEPNPAVWYEFCNPWCEHWSYTGKRPRHSSSVLAELVRCRALGITYLLDVGPMANGELQPEIVTGFAEVKAWMEVHRAAVEMTLPLPAGEKSSVPATVSKDGAHRFLFLLTRFTAPTVHTSMKESLLPPQDEVVTVTTARRPVQVTLMNGDMNLPFTYDQGTLTVTVAKNLRASTAIDVLKVQCSP